MRREFSHLVKIRVLRNGNPDNPVSVYASSVVYFEEDAKSSSSGILYEQSLRLIINREEAVPFMRLVPTFEAVAHLSDGVSDYIWGSIYIPVKVIVIPKLEKVVMEMSCNSVRPLIKGLVL